jgi:hypothetical protein
MTSVAPAKRARSSWIGSGARLRQASDAAAIGQEALAMAGEWGAIGERSWRPYGGRGRPSGSADVIYLPTCAAGAGGAKSPDRTQSGTGGVNRIFTFSLPAVR